MRKDKEKYNQYQSEYMNNRSVFLKLKAIDYKGGKCIHCGYDKYYGAMHFHHRDPTQKEMNWNRMRSQGWNKIRQELDKCVLVCSNCHAELHGDRRILGRVEKWREDIQEGQKDKVVGSIVVCANCKNEFVLKKGDKRTRKYCSRECAAKGREVIDWPADDELRHLVKEYGFCRTSKKLGVSEAAIRRRFKPL